MTEGTRTNGGDRATPAVDPSDLPTDVTDDEGGRRVGGVLLAAGTGSRYGGANKLLESVDDAPMVRHAAAALVESALDGVVVVVGHDADRVRGALEGLDVAVAVNPDYEAGQSTSLRAGVEAARERDWDATVFALGDMPYVSPTSVDLLLRAYRAGHGGILPAAYEHKRGNPVLFDGAYYDDLLAVEGDTGGRPVILGSDDVTLVETGDPGVLRDVDTREDLDRPGPDG